MSDSPSEDLSPFPPISTEAWRRAVETQEGEAIWSSLETWIEKGIALEPLYDERFPAASRSADGRGPKAAASFFEQGEAAAATPRHAWRIMPECMLRQVGPGRRSIIAELEGGADALWLRFRVGPESGILGVRELSALLETTGDPDLWLALDAGAHALPFAVATHAALRLLERDPTQLQGCWCADPLGVLAESGVLPAGLRGTHREMAELMRWSSSHTPSMRTLRISLSPYHAAGAARVDELALSLATFVHYLRVAETQGLAPESVARQTLISLPVRGEFFVDIAKLRAATRLWDQLLRHCGVEEEGSRPLLHVPGSTVNKSQRDPWLNLLRSTLESMVAVLGGADMVSTTPFDHALRRPAPSAVHLARNTQLILRDECRLHRVIDALEGSAYVESLSDRLARAAWARFQEIESLGGIEALLVRGKVRDWITQHRQQEARSFARRERVMVGVNAFVTLEEGKEVQGRRRPSTRQLDWSSMLQVALTEAEVPATRMRTVDFESLPTGELSAALSVVTAEDDRFAELAAVYRLGAPTFAIEPLAPFRWAGEYEALRDRSDAFFLSAGRRPSVFLFLPGMRSPSEKNAIVDWLELAALQTNACAAPVEEKETLLEAFKAQSSSLVLWRGTLPSAARDADLLEALHAAGAQRIYRLVDEESEDEDVLCIGSIEALSLLLDELGVP